MELINDAMATPARLSTPDTAGYLLIAAEIGHWAGPFASPSRRRRELLDRIAGHCATLGRRPDVIEAVAFRAALRPPGEGAEILARAGIRPARHDLAVLIRTSDTAALEAVQDDAAYRALVADVERCARDVHLLTAANAARIADVDHRGDRWFLFNFFYGEDTDTVYDVWEYTAGWFQTHTALPDSTLLRPLSAGTDGYRIVNHASWPRLRTFLPALLFHPGFRRFVLANFKANGVAAQPIIYRRTARAAGRGAR